MYRSVICLVLFAAIPCHSAPVRADVMGYWSFDSDTGAVLVDGSGRGNDGTIVNSPSLVAGHSGAAGDMSLDFDGSNHVLLGNLDDLKIAGDQTIMMWVYPTNIAAARQNPYAKAYGGSGTITQETSGAPNYYYGTAGGNAWPYTSHSGSVLAENAWNHMTLVRDFTNGELRWHINGLANSRAVPTEFESAVPGDNVAYFAEGYAGNYRGRIDDAAIWNEALSGLDISVIRSGLGSPLCIPQAINVVEYTYSATPNAHFDYYIDEGKDPDEDGVVDNPTGDLTDAILMGGAVVSDPDDSRVGWQSSTQVELIFNLGQRVNVTDMMIGYHYSFSPGNDAPDDVLVSFSDDGSVFSTPTTYGGFTGLATRNDLFIDLADTRAAYVKLYFDGGTANGLSKYVIDEVAFFSIPEPATACLLLLGIAGLAAGRRRRR